MNFAFFDLDKTLRDGYSNVEFLPYIAEKIGRFDLIERQDQLAQQFVNKTLAYNEVSKAGLAMSGELLAGQNKDLIERYTAEVFAQQANFFPWVEQLFAYLRHHTFQIYVISTGPEPAVAELCRQIGIEHFFATEFPIDSAGKYMGEVVLLDHLGKAEKLFATIEGVSEHHNTIGFGDSAGDAQMLAACDVGFLVNPPHPEDVAADAEKFEWIYLKHDSVLSQVSAALTEAFQLVG